MLGFFRLIFQKKKFSKIQIHDLRGYRRSAESQKRSSVDYGRCRPGQADDRSHTQGQDELSDEHHRTDHGHVRAQTSNLVIVQFLIAHVLGKLKNQKENRNLNNKT